MRKRLHQHFEDVGEKRESEVTMEDEIFLKQWQSPVHLAQEMNKELYELNVTAGNVRFWARVGALLLAVILLTLLFVAFRL